MKFVVTTVNLEKITLINPLKLKLTKTLDTPADSLVASFAILNPIDEITTVEIVENSSVIFCGDVDEQKTECSSKGVTLTISSRTNANLIDNEAYPTTYIRPSLKDIFRVHLKPYGIKGVLGDGICQGDFAVSKGTCHWSVVNEFCRCVLNVCPVITADGFLDVSNSFLEKPMINFSNNNEDAINYQTAQINHKRYGVIGKINYKSYKADDYKNSLYNELAQSRNICTERYLNLLGSKEWKRQYKLEREVQKSLKNSFCVDVVVPFNSDISIGQRAKIDDIKLGNHKDLCVYEITKEITNSKKYSKVTLVPIKHIV